MRGSNRFITSATAPMAPITSRVAHTGTLSLSMAPRYALPRSESTPRYYPFPAYISQLCVDPLVQLPPRKGLWGSFGIRPPLVRQRARLRVGGSLVKGQSTMRTALVHAHIERELSRVCANWGWTVP